jgi:tetratricopeptide (TPR) repeat protein
VDNKILLLREAVETAEKNFGEDFMRENTGHFWGIHNTRSYMRAKQDLAELLLRAGQTDEAIAEFEHMLELNPEDNQGIRDELVPLYLAQNLLEPARALMARYEQERTHFGGAAWAAVLERWLSHDLKGAHEALTEARSVNRHIEKYLSGRREFPSEDERPEYFRPGDESEAKMVAVKMARVHRSHAGFATWLRDQR